jgi:GH15 family glucan-1,4-alpha-glucosidase
VRRRPYGLSAIAGPDAVEFHAPVELKNENLRTAAAFEIEAGQSLGFALCYRPSHKAPAPLEDLDDLLAETEKAWREWAAGCTFAGDGGYPHWRDAVVRSLVTLKALTYRPSGGIVAAATTSLPERLGGERNWDYRFCWIRDGTLTLYALLSSGFRDEARAWRGWMLRAAAGHPAQLQIMYGLNGERRLTESELPWLKGYAGSRPVRIGNAAHAQRQLDVYGELIDTLHVARKYDLDSSGDGWAFQQVLLDELEKRWRDPDNGIWEVRGQLRHFTHSRLMCWVAFDRAIHGVEKFGLAGPVARWRRIRDEIHADVLANGWSEKRRSFVQSYGSDALDASLLLVPVVGFLPPDDPRVISTIEAIQRDLTHDGLVLRYQTEEADDGLAGREGTFLVCSFWMADALSMIGRRDEAEDLFERLLGMRNDLGLLAEEYDPVAGRQLGNFPQAFSHVGIVNTANNLVSRAGPAEQRAERSAPRQPA